MATRASMNAPSDEDQMDTLWEFVRNDPRTEEKAVNLRPGQYILEIGVQSFWQHPINRERLLSDDLRAYAKDIVDAWEGQRGTT